MTIQPGPVLTTSSTITLPPRNGWSETFTIGVVFPIGVLMTMPISGVGVLPVALYSGVGYMLLAMGVAVNSMDAKALKDGDTICPLTCWGTSGPGNSYLPIIPASICSMANRTEVAFVAAILTTTFWLIPDFTAVYPISGPEFPSAPWIWMATHPGPLLVTL